MVNQTLNFTLTIPPTFPGASTGAPPRPVTASAQSQTSDSLPSVSKDWGTWLMRCIIPSYASKQDKKVSSKFIDFINSFSSGPLNDADRTRLKSAVVLAEEHLKGMSSSLSSARLAHYVYQARMQLNDFEADAPQQAFQERCRSANAGLLKKWQKLGFDEQAFWIAPDLVDFVFRSHLHRFITYPAYGHTISTRLNVLTQGERITALQEPHLLMDGRQVPWSQIRDRIKIDKNNRLYSIEEEKKTYWMYLDEGLTQWDRKKYERPRHFRRLRSPPQSNRVEIITTHRKPEDFNIADRVLLQGTNHFFLRVVTGEGFSARNPQLGCIDGGVYSFGYGQNEKFRSIFAPLSTFRGRWYCPDGWEFYKEDLCITPIEITDEQVCNLFGIIIRRNQEENPFRSINSNCLTNGAQVLREAGIVDLSTKEHSSMMWYKLLVPEWIRKQIQKIKPIFNAIIPDFVSNGIKRLGSLLYSVIFSPILSLFGAWKTDLVFCEEDEEEGDKIAKSQNHIKALFSNVFDMFDPDRMTYDLTHNVYEWQRKQAGTYFERHE